MPSRVSRLAFYFGLAACGAKTGLNIGVETGDAAVDSNSLDSGEDTAETSAANRGFVYCSQNQGPVASCDAGAEAGPVQRCTDVFPYCINPKTINGWGCCVSPGPGNCLWAYFATFPTGPYVCR